MASFAFALSSAFGLYLFFPAKNEKLDSLDLLKPYFSPPHKTKVLGDTLKGLNIEGVCLKENCQAFKQVSIIPVKSSKKEVLDIAEQICNALCPSCQRIIDWDNTNGIVLNSCVFSIHAMGSDSKK